MSDDHCLLHAINIFGAMSQKKHSQILTAFMELKINRNKTSHIRKRHLMDLSNCIEMKTFLLHKQNHKIVNRCRRGKLIRFIFKWALVKNLSNMKNLQWNKIHVPYLNVKREKKYLLLYLCESCEWFFFAGKGENYLLKQRTHCVTAKWIYIVWHILLCTYKKYYLLCYVI